MKAQFLKIAGVNSEEEFYNMFPTEESFFRAHPEAQQMAQGGQPYPWSYPEYGMQGKGAGAQIPVETWFAYGGFTSKPSATLVHYGDGGMGQYSHPSNYGAFPAFAQKGNQVQGGGIDAATSSRLKNFLSGIQANTQKALNDQAMEEAMQMNQELMPQMIAQYGAEMGSRFNPNMYGQNMIQNTLDQLNQENQFATRDFLNMGKFFANNMINNKLSDISDKQKRDMQMEEEIGKDAQTVPGFNPIPENMAKLGGSLKKYQTGAQTGTPNYTSPTPPISDLDINKIIEDTQKAGKDAVQKEKDTKDLNRIQNLKSARDHAIETYRNNPQGYKYSSPFWFADPMTITPEQQAKEIRDLDEAYKKAYNNYFSSRNIASTSPAPQTPGAQTTSTSQCGAGQKWSSLYKICYTPITSNDQYYGGIGNSNKSAEQLAAEKEWTRDPNHLSYYEWSQTQPDTQQPAPAPAKTQAKTPAPKAAAKPVAPVKKQITQSDTLGLAAAKKAMGVKKYGGSLNKYNAGGGVKGTSGNFTFYNDGSIINNTTNTWVQDADPNWKPEGVPPMTYEGTEQPTEKTTGTTTTTTSGDITDPKEKAVRDLAIAYGQDPDQTWTQYQALMNYGTMGAGTQQPYGYGVSSMVPYRYRHRGYGTIGLDRGYVPGVGDLAAMQEQANRMGYEFTGKSRPTLFGGRKVVIKTHYNPATGVVENKPAVVDTPVNTPANTPVVAGMASDAQGNSVMVNQTPFTTVIPSREDQIIQNLDAKGFYINHPTVPSTYAPTSEPRQGFENADEEPWHPPLQRQGGALNKFLPKHQVMGETGFKFDNLDINIPIMDTIHNIGEKYQHGLTSIKDFNQERKQKRDERRGTDEKAVWKTGPSPYAADTILTSMAFASNLGRGKERKALEDELANKMSSDYMFTAVGKNKGDYVPTGQTYGEFRPNQKTPTFDTGYQRGNANRPYYGGFDKGGSPGYSDWSQTPVNGYYGVPQGEFSPYSQWSQSPVKMAMGGTPTEQYLTDEEIAEIIQMGGQVEYLD